LSGRTLIDGQTHFAFENFAEMGDQTVGDF